MTPARPRPFLTDLNRFYWTSGADGRLRFLRCATCETWIHPPQPICPSCLTDDVAPEPVAGTGTIISLTVNHQRWLPDVPVPYVIVRVAIDGAHPVILTSNVVDCAYDAVAIGDRVDVTFDEQDGIFFPVFRQIAALAA